MPRVDRLQFGRKEGRSGFQLRPRMPTDSNADVNIDGQHRSHFRPTHFKDRSVEEQD